MTSTRRDFIRRMLMAGAGLPPMLNARALSLFWPGLEPETYNWVGRVKIASSSVSGPTIAKNDRFCKSVKAAGIRSALKRVNTLTGNDINACKAPYINDVGDAQDSFLPTAWAAGAYSEATGLTPGANQYLGTGVILANAPFGENDLHAGVYVRNGTNEASVCAGIQAVPNDIALMPCNGGISYWDCNNAATGRISAADSNGVGFYLGSRSSASSSVLYKAGVSIASTTNAGGTRPGSTCTPQWTWFCIDDSGICTAAYSSRNMAFTTLGLGLNATQAVLYSGIVQALMTAFARQVP